MEAIHFFEEQILAPYAVKASNSLGRKVEERECKTRTCFQRDRDRIVHSKAFRRLREKTQVFISTESDHYRSRLTHSIEVAQISRHLARLLRLNEDLAESVAFAHDLGHSPFGHAGEAVLNECMKENGGFEHNLQSLRIVEELENKYPDFNGLNLSFEVKEGLKKHQSPWDNPDKNFGFISLEAQVVNLADQIAYNNHDIDDGLSSEIICPTSLEKEVFLWKEAVHQVRSQYSSLNDETLRSLCISHIISSQIEDVVKNTQNNLKIKAIETQEDLQSLRTQCVCFSKEMEEKVKVLRDFLYKNFYIHPKVYRMNKKGQNIIKALFEIIVQDKNLLPIAYQNRLKKDTNIFRVAADYISGMTDPYAAKLYNNLFN